MIAHKCNDTDGIWSVPGSPFSQYNTRSPIQSMESYSN